MALCVDRTENDALKDAFSGKDGSSNPEFITATTRHRDENIYLRGYNQTTSNQIHEVCDKTSKIEGTLNQHSHQIHEVTDKASKIGTQVDNNSQ